MITGIVDRLLYTILGMISVGSLAFNIYASQVNQHDRSLVADYLKSILLLNHWLGLGFTLVIGLCGNYLLHDLFGLTDGTLVNAQQYLFAVVGKIYLTMLVFSLTNQLKALKQTRWIFLIGSGTSILHLLGALVCVGLVPPQQRLVVLGWLSTGAIFLTVLGYAYLLRQELQRAFSGRSTKKLFLLKKSWPLFLQELLEGSLFTLLVTALLSRASSYFFAVYQLCCYLTELFLVPMYLYCNALVVLIGEKFRQQRLKAVRQLPISALKIVWTSYFITATIGFLLRNQLLPLFTSNADLIVSASHFLCWIILLESVRPFYELNKYSLQTLGQENLVLKLTALVNGVGGIVLVGLNVTGNLSFSGILLIVALSYLLLGISFGYFYQETIE